MRRGAARQPATNTLWVRNQHGIWSRSVTLTSTALCVVLEGLWMWCTMLLSATVAGVTLQMTIFTAVQTQRLGHANLSGLAMLSWPQAARA